MNSMEILNSQKNAQKIARVKMLKILAFAGCLAVTYFTKGIWEIITTKKNPRLFEKNEGFIL